MVFEKSRKGLRNFKTQKALIVRKRLAHGAALTRRPSVTETVKRREPQEDGERSAAHVCPRERVSGVCRGSCKPRAKT